MAVYIEAGLIVVKDNYEAIVDNDLLPYNTKLSSQSTHLNIRKRRRQLSLELLEKKTLQIIDQ